MFPVKKTEPGKLYVAIAESPENNVAFVSTDSKIIAANNIWMPEVGEAVHFFDSSHKESIKALIKAVPTDALGAAIIRLVLQKETINCELTEIIPALIAKPKPTPPVIKEQEPDVFVAAEVAQVLKVAIKGYEMGAEVSECVDFIRDAMEGLTQEQKIEIREFLTNGDNAKLKEIKAKHDSNLLAKKDQESADQVNQQSMEPVSA